MNSNNSFVVEPSPNGKLFLKAAVLVSLAVTLGLSLSDAIASADTAASAPATEVHKSKRVMSDSWITTKVKSEILKSSLAKGFDVKVTTLHGIVTLRGTLASAEAIDQVKAVAAKVKGVQSVDTSPLVVAAK